MTDRTLCATQVAWAPGTWTSDQDNAATDTVSFSDAVAEVLAVSGWEVGNAMGFVFTETVEASGNRKANSFETVNNRPELCVSFVGKPSSLSLFLFCLVCLFLDSFHP